MGRVLTGRMPSDPSEEDFFPFTCGVSTFKRRQLAVPPTSISTTTSSPSPIPSWRSWRDGSGVGGGWNCVSNGDCSFLSGGAERGWHFTGEEDFTTDIKPVEESGADVWVDGASGNDGSAKL